MQKNPINFTSLGCTGNEGRWCDSIGARYPWKQSRATGRPLSRARREREERQALNIVKLFREQGCSAEVIAEVLEAKYGNPVPVDLVRLYVDLYL